MQRPLSPVFGRALPSEMAAASAQRGHKSRARAIAAIGDPIDEPIVEGVDGSAALDAPLKISEKIVRHLEVVEKAVETSLKKMKPLQQQLYSTMSENPDSKRAISQMFSGFNKKIGSLSDQLRSLNFEDDVNLMEQRGNPHAHVRVRSDSSPSRTMRRMCASPVRKLQTWRL